MATETNSNSHGFLYFIVGVLMLGVVVLGVMMFNGGFGGSSDGPIERSAAAVGEAADNAADSVSKAAPSGG